MTPLRRLPLDCDQTCATPALVAREWRRTNCWPRPPQSSSTQPGSSRHHDLDGDYRPSPVPGKPAGATTAWRDCGANQVLDGLRARRGGELAIPQGPSIAGVCADAMLPVRTREKRKLQRGAVSRGVPPRAVTASRLRRYSDDRTHPGKKGGLECRRRNSER